MTLESQSCHSENSVVPSGYSSINSRTGFLRQCESLRTAPLTREQEIHEDLSRTQEGLCSTGNITKRCILTGDRK